MTNHILKKKILIIGGCGYIGSALRSSMYFDYHIDTVDLGWFGNVIAPHNIPLDYRNLTPEQLAEYDVIVLLAGHSSVPMSNNSDVQSTFKNNVVNFLELLPKLRKGQKFIYAGSSSVYNGIPDDNVTEEYKLLAPSNIYDLTKQEIDRLIMLYPDIEYYGLRFATVNGFSPNLRTDIMINMMVENVLHNGVINLTNTSIRRPILHMVDLCNAIILHPSIQRLVKLVKVSHTSPGQN